MASKEEIVEAPNHKILELRVSIHCEGCKKKVKKILRNIPGVRTIEIDAKQNKVTVTGDVEANMLIQRLAKSGKVADIWPEKKTAPGLKDQKKEEQKKETEPEISAATEKIPAATNSVPAETSKKPADTPEKPDDTTPAPAEKESPTTSNKEPAKSDTVQNDTRPDTDTTAVTCEKKKKEKQKEPEVASERHSGNSTNYQPLPPPYHHVPAYQHPVYAVSHNTAHPMASNSYYYAPNQTMPQNYSRTMPPNYGPYYSPPPQYNSYYGSEGYYGNYTDRRASPSRQERDGLDMFNDENANSCTVM